MFENLFYSYDVGFSSVRKWATMFFSVNTRINLSVNFLLTALLSSRAQNEKVSSTWCKCTFRNFLFEYSLSIFSISPLYKKIASLVPLLSACGSNSQAHIRSGAPCNKSVRVKASAHIQKVKDETHQAVTCVRVLCVSSSKAFLSVSITPGRGISAFCNIDVVNGVHRTASSGIKVQCWQFVCALRARVRGAVKELLCKSANVNCFS